jgi:hypothetical protein
MERPMQFESDFDRMHKPLEQRYDEQDEPPFMHGLKNHTTAYRGLRE